jgi:competence protein ComEC
VLAIRLDGEWLSVEGGAIVTVGGDAAPERVDEWRAGRTIEAPLTFRRAARFLNDGVPDAERDLALDGVTLLASAKSALLIDVVSRAHAIAEIAAAVRWKVRSAIARWVAPHDPSSSAIATAILIGDRGGLSDDARDRLQRAGTYHVIAISGGNIAIVAAVVTGVLALAGLRGARAAVPTMVLLVGYALIATSGPSVWRATLMAVLYFGARAIDHRVPAWHATAIAAALMVVVHPLDVRDPGFVLTFGATAALIEGGRRGAALMPRHRVVGWVAASIGASLAVETALLPISAQMFSRVTSAGLVLNLLAVPMTAVIQVAAMITVACDQVGWIAAPAGEVTHLAATALLESARLVTVAPWLSARVPAPGIALICAYYATLLFLIGVRRLRVVTIPALIALGILISTGTGIPTTASRQGSHGGSLRVTMFDVGQGDATLIETPAGETMLVDTGGSPFGSGADVGHRVLAPTLWARGIRLHTLLLTHGDPDHIGGAPAIVEDFAPPRVWEGIRVPTHLPSVALAAQVARQGSSMTPLRAGHDVTRGDLTFRVLNPPEPDWERRRVRNDDSVVLEILYRDVAVLMTGDISAEVERALVPALTPARIRILKVAHHGSRTSTSQALLDGWPPAIALISCGRGNRFGHPAPEVVERLAASGATVLRTDRDGQITIETDGHTVSFRTFVGQAEHGEHGEHGGVSH